MGRVVLVVVWFVLLWVILTGAIALVLTAARALGGGR